MKKWVLFITGLNHGMAYFFTTRWTVCVPIRGLKTREVWHSTASISRWFSVLVATASKTYDIHQILEAFSEMAATILKGQPHEVKQFQADTRNVSPFPPIRPET